jgi:hypothetical protein
MTISSWFLLPGAALPTGSSVAFAAGPWSACFGGFSRAASLRSVRPTTPEPRSYRPVPPPAVPPKSAPARTAYQMTRAEAAALAEAGLMPLRDYLGLAERNGWTDTP